MRWPAPDAGRGTMESPPTGIEKFQAVQTTMKLYVLSDLHAESAVFRPDAEALRAADVVVLAGDIHNGEYTPFWAREAFGDKPIILVAGNHEFYDRHWERCLMDMRKAAGQCGVHFLENETLTIDGVDFLGATFWTDFELMGAPNKEESIQAAKRFMTDYRQIAGCTPERTIERHQASRTWLASELAKPLQRTRVVVTHHYPSPRSTAAEYEGEPANGAFGSALGRDFFENTHLWIHGHTHTSFDYLEHGCRVVCNPRGYLRRGEIGRASCRERVSSPV